MTRRENAQKMMFRKNNKIPNCPRPDLDKKHSDFRERERKMEVGGRLRLTLRRIGEQGVM